METNEQVVAPEATEEVKPAEINIPEPKEEAAPVYEPNFKYKVYDQELEFDEKVRNFIKDKDTEEYFRGVYARAGALDKMKEKYTGLQEKVNTHYSKLENEHQTLNSNLDELSAMVQKNDLYSFFQALGIPEEKILQYALQRAQYNELPPEQRAMHDRRYQESWQSQQLAKQNQAYEERETKRETQIREMMLDNELTKNNDFVQQFDEKFGPGAFRQEVIREGSYNFSAFKKDLMPGEIIGNLKQKYAAVMGGGQAPVTANSNPNQVVNKNAKKPTIPNVQGSGGSPARKVVTSIDDLRKIYNAM